MCQICEQDCNVAELCWAIHEASIEAGMPENREKTPFSEQLSEVRFYYLYRKSHHFHAICLVSARVLRFSYYNLYRRQQLK